MRRRPPPSPAPTAPSRSQSAELGASGFCPALNRPGSGSVDSAATHHPVPRGTAGTQPPAAPVRAPRHAGRDVPGAAGRDGKRKLSEPL
ncbi:hypothetical protein HispidOSU_022514 [Sigmodon hispidus]